MKALFIDSNHPVMHETLEGAGLACDLWYDKPEAELKAFMPDYEVWVIRSKFKITADVIDKAPKLRVIARAGAGMENIDVAYAEAKGIKCLHAPEGNKDAVGEQALGMLLALSTNLIRADREVRQGIWRREENRGWELDGKTIGIIGFGNMGQAFARRLKGFGVNIIVYDKYKKDVGTEEVREVGLSEIWEKADVISLHTPLTEETRYWLNADFFKRCKRGVVIVNTARGKCLHTADLADAIQSGQVGGACLDVLEYEAVSFETVDITEWPAPFTFLTQSDRVVLSPHIAGWTKESHVKIGKVLAEKILMALGMAF